MYAYIYIYTLSCVCLCTWMCLAICSFAYYMSIVMSKRD